MKLCRFKNANNLIPTRACTNIRRIVALVERCNDNEPGKKNGATLMSCDASASE
jgi:hypothetical protein